MRFSIINPSDPYTMTAPDLKIAAIAICLLGHGGYPLDGLDDAAGQDVPAFLFGSPDPWFQEHFGASFDETLISVIDKRCAELAETLESVTLGRATRSSLNDIGASAQLLAEHLRIRHGLVNAQKD